MVRNFQNFLLGDRIWRAEVDGLPFVSVPQEEAVRLETSFTEEWVFVALNGGLIVILLPFGRLPGLF